MKTKIESDKIASTSNEQALIASTSQSPSPNQTTEEDVDLTEIEIPPPMAIQEHSYQAIISEESLKNEQLSSSATQETNV